MINSSDWLWVDTCWWFSETLIHNAAADYSLLVFSWIFDAHQFSRLVSFRYFLFYSCCWVGLGYPSFVHYITLYIIHYACVWYWSYCMFIATCWLCQIVLYYLCTVQSLEWSINHMFALLWLCFSYSLF